MQCGPTANCWVSGSTGATTGDSAVLTAWRLDTTADRWVELSQITATTALPERRFVSAADQFFVYDPIATDDGFVLWGGWEGGWRFTLDAGWSRIPEIPKPDGGRYNGTSALWDAGRLRAVVSSGGADFGGYGDLFLDEAGWSALIERGRQVDLVMPQAVAVDEGIVVLDPFLRTPVFIGGDAMAVDVRDVPARHGDRAGGGVVGRATVRLGWAALDRCGRADHRRSGPDLGGRCAVDARRLTEPRVCVLSSPAEST